jgi:hypothetical protein
MVTNQKGRQHRSRWNLKRLDDEGSYKKRQENCDTNRLEIFSENRFFFPDYHQNKPHLFYKLTYLNFPAKLLEIQTNYK